MVADGSHAGTVIDLDEGAESVLGGGGVLSTGREVTVRSIDADGTVGEPTPVDDAGAPVADVAPVVDDDGSTWLLTDGDQAVRVDPDGSVGDRVDVDPDTSGLLVVDGRAYATGSEALVELGGDRRRPAAGDRGVVPAVAQATDGRWAVASGRQITLDDDPDDIVTAPDDVRSLAVWFGRVWSATDDVVFDVDSDEEIDGVEGPYQVFADGGRLWFVGSSGAIAIDREQQATVFRLAGVDLSLCAGDCSPEAAVDFLDEITTTTQPADDEAIARPRRDRRSRCRRSCRRRRRRPPHHRRTGTTEPTESSTPTGSSVAPTSTVAPPLTPETGPATSAVATTTPAPTTVPATLPPIVTLVTDPPDQPDPPNPPEPPSPPPSTTTPPPAGGGGVILAFTDGGGPTMESSTTVQVGFDGTRDQCIGNGGSVTGRSTIGVLRWSGAGSGSRSVAVSPGGSGGSETIDLQPGQLSVTFSVCNLSASISRTVQPEVGPAPVIGDIVVNGGTPTVGRPFSASVSYSYGDGLVRRRGDVVELWRPLRRQQRHRTGDLVGDADGAGGGPGVRLGDRLVRRHRRRHDRRVGGAPLRRRRHDDHGDDRPDDACRHDRRRPHRAADRAADRAAHRVPPTVPPTAPPTVPPTAPPTVPDHHHHGATRRLTTEEAHVTDHPPPSAPRVISGATTAPVAKPATGSGSTTLSDAEVTWFAEMFARLATNVGRRIQGKDDQIGYALIALVSEGHLLLEDVPGVGKTSLARALAESVSGTWSRVQFTPDLLPSDITGISIFNQASRQFEFHAGPIFANIVIGDEINRASPKTQSAMLEVMEERRVTVDGIAHHVPRPFVVVATQNPIEMDAGTYALPEAQLDRFLLKMAMGYPDAAAEAEIVTARHGGAPGPLEPVLELEEIERMIAISSSVRTDPQIVQYVVGLVHATRHTGDVRLGASPRGSIGLLRAAQTLAAAEGRPFVIADDVKRLAVPVLAHRLIVAPDAQLRGITADRVIVDLLGRQTVPGGVVA